MTTSDRAKAFLASKIKRTALVILPLAAAAVQCHATVTFSSSTGSFNGSGSFPNLPTTAVNTAYSFATVPSGVNGMTVAGGATFTANASGLGNSGGSFCGVMCAGLFATGSGAGTFDSDSLLVNYDFTLTSSNNDTIDWFLSVDIGGQQNSTFDVDPSGSEVTGSFLITGLLSVPSSFNWTIDLTTDLFHNVTVGDQITLDIPLLTSIDVGAQTPVPEPSTAWLFSGAGAALVFLRRFWRG